MALNKAAQQLQSLMSASDDMSSTQDAATLLQNTQREIGYNARPADKKEATFSAPEAVATGVAAGFILGPVGGVLLGVAQGILGKNAKQNALDQWAAQDALAQSTNQVFDQQIDALSMSATSDLDREQLNTLRTQKDASLKFLTSADPRMQQQGAQMLSSFQTGLNDYAVRQETQQIAREAAAQQARLDMDAKQYSRYTTSISNFRNESAQYEETQRAVNVAREALASGSPADLHAAGVLINKALDPESVVRQEEAEAVGALGSLWDKGATILSKAVDGKQILPQQRRDLDNLLKTIESGSKEIQLAREARYSDEVFDIGLPDKYHNNFRLVDSVPVAEPAAITGDNFAPGDLGRGITDPLSDAAATVVDAAAPFSDQAILDTVGNLVESGSDKLGEVGDSLAQKWLDTFVPKSVKDGRPTN